MKIIVACDSFKESLSSQKVNSILEECVKSVFPGAEIRKVSIADGGEGTIDSILAHTTGNKILSTVMGPLPDMKIDAEWAILQKGEVAIIESANNIGLNLLPVHKRNPGITTTYGIGEIIIEAASKGIKKIYLALGGSSTNDGGAGILSALGIKFLDEKNELLPFGCKSLINLKKIDISGVTKKINDLQIICLCDVENTLCGEKGATSIFAPQKGAKKEDIPLLDSALRNYAEVIKRDTGKDILNLRGGGAAGGIAAGLSAILNAEIKSGINIILDIINFNKIISDTDLIITGEGKIDSQTLSGKAISGITVRARKFNIPVIAFCGIAEENINELCKDLGIVNIFPSVNKNVTLEESILNSEKYLHKAGMEGLLWYKNLIKGK